MKNCFPWLLAVLLAGRVYSCHGFDGDGYSDIIWYNEPRGSVAVWYVDGTKFTTARSIATDLEPGWHVAASDDFNRDGHSDLFLRSPKTGENEIWLMIRSRRIERSTVATGSPDFALGGTGDFDGDGYVDLLWRDHARNITVVWFMNGVTFTGGVGWFNAPTRFAWDVAVTGDFNNDGSPDIVWRDRFTGNNFIWLLNGTDLIESVEIPPQPNLKDKLVATGSFNLIGMTDLIWRHADGRNTIWRMHGTDFQSSTELPTVDIKDWQIGGAGGYTNEMLLSAVSDERFTSLNLHWRYGRSVTPDIKRREFGTSNWELVATNYVPSWLSEFDLEVGKRYEYEVAGNYLLTGIAAEPIEDRGKIILVVEQSIAAGIAEELQVLRTDLAGDGWSFVQTNVQRHIDNPWTENIAAIHSIKSFITNAYYDDPDRTKAVYLIGHVPIPYSGFNNPDGHGSRALPADVYYADVDARYTDEIVHSLSRLQGPRFFRHDNLISDGKFDQSQVPTNRLGIAEIELAIGRADFASLSSFFPLNEIDLTKRYLQKVHHYRHHGSPLPDRIAVDTFFPSGPNRDAHGQALKMSSRLFGADPKHLLKADPLDPNNPALWGIVAGSGLPSGLAYNAFSYHQSIDFGQTNKEPRVAFANFFGSFFVDFHYKDNVMRSFLATPRYGLAAMWFKPVSIDRIPLGFEGLGLGETIGSGFVRTMNESTRNRSHNMFLALLGDPTLRLQVLEPPGDIRISESGITVEWQPSADTNATYLLYRSKNGLNGPWQRVTPAPTRETQFTDLSALFRPVSYQVRAAKLITTASGSFTNLSQGVFVEAK